MEKVITFFEDDTNYDKYVSKTFVADDIEPPRLVEYLTKGGVTVMQDFVNIYITDPTGVRRVITDCLGKELTQYQASMSLTQLQVRPSRCLFGIELKLTTD